MVISIECIVREQDENLDASMQLNYGEVQTRLHCGSDKAEHIVILALFALYSNGDWQNGTTHSIPGSHGESE